MVDFGTDQIIFNMSRAHYREASSVSSPPPSPPLLSPFPSPSLHQHHLSSPLTSSFNSVSSKLAELGDDEILSLEEQTHDQSSSVIGHSLPQSFTYRSTQNGSQQDLSGYMESNNKVDHYPSDEQSMDGIGGDASDSLEIPLSSSHLSSRSDLHSQHGGGDGLSTNGPAVHSSYHMSHATQNNSSHLHSPQLSWPPSPQVLSSLNNGVRHPPPQPEGDLENHAADDRDWTSSTARSERGTGGASRSRPAKTSSKKRRTERSNSSIGRDEREKKDSKVKRRKKTRSTRRRHGSEKRPRSSSASSSSSSSSASSPPSSTYSVTTAAEKANCASAPVYTQNNLVPSLNLLHSDIAVRVNEDGKRDRAAGIEEIICEHYERLHGMTFHCECNVKNLCPFHCCREHGRVGTVPGQSGEVVGASSGPIHHGSNQKEWRRRHAVVRRRDVVDDTISLRLFADSDQAAEYLAQERGASRLNFRLCYSYAEKTRESFDVDPHYVKQLKHSGDILGSDHHTHSTAASFCLHRDLLICL